MPPHPFRHSCSVPNSNILYRYIYYIYLINRFSVQTLKTCAQPWFAEQANAFLNENK